MNETETLKILAVLKGAYPSFYRDMGRKEADGVVGLWAEMFAEDDYAVVAAAVKALIATDEKGFPPHIGAVKARIRQITIPVDMTEAEAWALVHRAVRNSLYGSAEQFERLPDMLRRLVGSQNQLREWAMMDSETVESVVASNFQRSYRARAKSQHELSALPSDVRAMMAEIAESVALPVETEPMERNELRRRLETSK